MPGVTTDTYDDTRPNVRRDGLEIVFDSKRTGLGGFNVWSATRSRLGEPFGTGQPGTERQLRR